MSKESTNVFGERYKDKILFVDEYSGLLLEELNELEKNHIVIGFL